MGSHIDDRCRQRGTLDSEMRRDVSENTRELANAEARVIEDRNVMLTALVRCEPHVTPPVSRVTA